MDGCRRTNTYFTEGFTNYFIKNSTIRFPGLLTPFCHSLGDSTGQFPDLFSVESTLFKHLFSEDFQPSSSFVLYIVNGKNSWVWNSFKVLAYWYNTLRCFFKCLPAWKTGEEKRRSKIKKKNQKHGDQKNPSDDQNLQITNLQKIRIMQMIDNLQVMDYYKTSKICW